MRSKFFAPLTVGLCLGCSIGQGLAVDNYKLAFDYEPAPLYVRSLSQVLGISETDARHLHGTLQIQADADLFYSELRVGDDLKFQEWRYPNRVVRYNHAIKALEVYKPERATSDIIPIWLPSRYPGRQFVRDTSECEAGTGLCVEYPGHTDRVIRLPETKVGNVHNLSLPGRDNDFLISWELDDKKLQQVSVRDSFKTQVAPGSTDLEIQRSNISFIGEPATALTPGNWEDLAKEASSITIEGTGIVYDPNKGSVWDQKLAAIRAWKDAGKRKKPPENGPSTLIYSVVGVGVLLFLVGAAKVLLNQLRKA